MSELWLLRHTEPLEAGCYIGRGSNPSLSPAGRKEAERIASVLCSGAKVPEVICSSPLARAVETAQPLAKKLNISIERFDGLAEIDFGEWEGLNWKQIEEEDGELWKAWLDNPYKVAPPGGETLECLRDRVIREINGILERHRGHRVLITSHGGPLRTVLGHALELDPSAWWNVAIDYGSLCRFSLRGHGMLSLMQWNVPVRLIETE